MGGTYTATINNKSYAQSQRLLMDILPTEEQINQKSEIELVSSLLGQDYINIQHSVPPHKDFFHKEWKLVTIGISRNHTINNHGITGKIEQYSLKCKLLFL